jgi:hypothetical protein
VNSYLRRFIAGALAFVALAATPVAQVGALSPNQRVLLLGGAARQSIPAVPTRTYDFVNGAYTADGSTTTVGAAIVGTPRTFTQPFLGDNWGAKTDPAYSNLYSVDLSTGTTGTVYTNGALTGPGAFPTGLSLVSPMGLSIDYTVLGANEGQMRAYGTATASGNLRLFLAGPTAITVVGSTTYTVSLQVQQVGTCTGPSISLGGSPFSKGAQYNTAAGSFVSSSFPVGNPIRSDDQIYVPVTEVVTTPATGVRLAPILSMLNIPNGSTVDCTFKFKEVQVTLGTGTMQYLGRGASAAADNLTINNWPTVTDFSFTAAFRAPPDNYSGSIYEIGSGANRIEVLQTSYSVSIKVVNGGVTTQTTLGLILPWQRNKVALSVTGGAVLASLNGKPAVSCGTAPSLSGAKFGSGTTGPLRGSVETGVIYNVGLNAANVKTLATLSNAMFDDFDRANGALSTAWTGQPYQQTGTAASAVISSKTVVTTDSGGATTSAYFMVDMGSTPKIGGGAMAWLNQAGSASAGLISTPNNTSVSDGSAAPGIVQGSAHFLAAVGGLFAGKFSSGVLTDHQWNYSSSVLQPKDGVTSYPIVWLLRPSDGAMAVRTWNGETEYFAGENYYAAAGRYFVPESYWSVPQPVGQPIWTNWGAEVNWLLKRDLDPAANDNDPMWLEKAG